MDHTNEIINKVGSGYEIYVRAPGRINLIGEHTDYNLGYVMPAAIDRYIYFGIKKNGTKHSVRLNSINFEQEYIANLEALKSCDLHWANYLLGVIEQVQKKSSKLQGFDVNVYGDIPIGSGLSSSAAIECGMAKAIAALFEIPLSEWDIVHIGNRTEHEFLGIKSGILDQFACTFGKKDHAMLMNCATRAYQYVPVKMDLHTFLVVNSMVKHTHLTSGYLDRVQECETALSYFQKLDQKIQSLSDVTLHQLEIAKGKLDQTAWKRASFIYSENKRVLSFQEAFEKGDYSGLGKHLNDCHKGLSEEYEVSCSELDLLQSIAVSLDGVKGARMMGGGFGGCTLNLVELDKVDEVSERIKQQYFDQLGIRAESYKLNIVDGVNEAF